GAELSRKQRIYAFALVTSLFFTWGFAYGLLDVLNAHFQTVFGISKLQSTMLQLAYFVPYFVWAPFAGAFMSRIGYKKGVHIGLGLYSLGAVFFWPSAKFEKYGGFVGSTFVIGCGLATLEVAANSYISVGVAAFAVNYFEDQGVGISAPRASDLFSFCQITFTVGRFVGVLLLNFIDPAFLLACYGGFCTLFCILVSQLPGYGGVASLFLLFFFESICYPCIFTLGTKNLGIHTKRGSGLIVMGVGGGAWYPSAQGALADKANTRRSYLVPMSGYIAMTIYAV
ncbi:hypothetical protein PISMIDRAFT_91885, partial [Pisolithus microcarpus 441]